MVRVRALKVRPVPLEHPPQLPGPGRGLGPDRGHELRKRLQPAVLGERCAELRPVLASLAERVQDARCTRFTYLGQQLEYSEPRDTMARIVCPGDHGYDVLHVCGFGELHPAVLPVRDAAGGKLELEV